MDKNTMKNLFIINGQWEIINTYRYNYIWNYTITDIISKNN